MLDRFISSQKTVSFYESLLTISKKTVLNIKVLYVFLFFFLKEVKGTPPRFFLVDSAQRKVDVNVRRRVTIYQSFKKSKMLEMWIYAKQSLLVIN